ncbi:MAG TPA: response regulator [Verrucomicrobiae bacterium]|jgi:DNA-binding NtrC family response regulator|nr:response regulator [Verrucomicrobiae bacterium]
MKSETSARWMVVDDDVDALDAVARLLAAVSDAEVCAFPSPWQALDAFAAAPESFLLVVTDYEMPGMNGVDFRRHVQAMSPTAKVLLTTGGGKFNEESARQNGFCGLLPKPFSISALKETLTTVEARAVNFSKTSPDNLI